MLAFAADCPTPVAIRYPRGAAPRRRENFSVSAVRHGRAEVLVDGGSVAVLALGSMLAPAADAADLLSKEGVRVTLVNVRFAKPLDEGLILKLYDATEAMVTVEEGVVTGGFGSGVLEALRADGRLFTSAKKVKCLGLPASFITFGKRKELLRQYGLCAEGIAAAVREVLGR
jgi:1-deoxy-D-xylulose-5-phosphate synthase